MRVLLVNSHGADSTYGGAEHYADVLGTGLVARGHEVEVLSAFPVGNGWAAHTTVLHRTDWRDSRIRRVRNHVGDVVAAPWPRLRAAVEAAAPDLVHTNNLPGIATGIWESARRLGIPVVHTLHDYQLLCPRTSLVRRDGSPCHPSPLLCGARTRRLIRWAGGVRAVIGVSEHILHRHDGLFPDAAERVVRPPLAPLDDPTSRWQVVAERTLLAALGGGCQAPVAAYTGTARLFGRVTASDGSVQITASAPVDRAHPAVAGTAVAALLAAQGAGKLLAR